MSTIEIKNLSKNYGKTAALKNISLKLLPNKIYGFLGRNGAGKTTLLNIITNKIFASKGEVLIDGENAVENDKAQSKLFHMADKNLYPVDLKIKHGFIWAKEFYPEFDADYAYSLAEKFSLNTEQKVKALSTGFQSIFKLILTLSSGAPVLLFDEPVLGLDANHRELFYKELITNYSEHPKTIIISTHLIDEISDVLEEVIIIKNGEIILYQPLEQVLELAYTVSGNSSDVDKYSINKNIIREEMMGSYKAVTIFEERSGGENNSLKALGLEITPARLQELFISLTN